MDAWRTDQGHYAFEEMQGWLTNPKPLDTARLGGVGVGLVRRLAAVAAARTQFVWWPLHPIGYAVGNTDTMTWIWCPVMLGWLCKDTDPALWRRQYLPPGTPFLYRPGAGRLRLLRPLGTLLPRHRPLRLSHVPDLRTSLKETSPLEGRPCERSEQGERSPNPKRGGGHTARRPFHIGLSNAWRI